MSNTLPLPFFDTPPPTTRIPQWRTATKGHPRLMALADRHYTRQSKGSNQCCRPGHNFVLLLDDGSAAWVVWRPIPDVGRMDNLEAWECTLFRNEGVTRSSDLVASATTLTYRAWGWPPRDGLITAVGISETSRRRSKRHEPGWCFLCAGWEPTSKRGDRVWFRAPRPVRVPRARCSIGLHEPQPETTNPAQAD